MRGGDLIAEVLYAQGVPFLFTLCGGHISPILVGCKQKGIRVIDTRHEATAVFAADATARLTGRPGVAAVTAGPGVTNTITAVKNAQMAQSPVVLIGGAAPTVLQGKGALQDIDQMALMKPHVKWAKHVSRIRDLVPSLERAFLKAQTGVPGPVFIECPVDLLYDEAVIREWYGLKSDGRTLSEKMLKLYLRYHLNRLFAGAERARVGPRMEIVEAMPSPIKLRRVANRLQRAERPVLLVGSQATLRADRAEQIAAAVDHLGIPTYLSGMARGLLGRNHRLQLRHKRREALKEADLVILAGVPCDFRLDYGRHIRRGAFLVSANRSRSDLIKNRHPNLAVWADPGLFLCGLAEMKTDGRPSSPWLDRLRQNDVARESEIEEEIKRPGEKVNPLFLCREVDASLSPRAIIVADGGDFVSTASYIVRPTGPLTWLDPGAFGTLGVGAGFALGAKLCHPEAEVWILFGDGSVGYSLTEFDTFRRHELPVIAVVGNDAGWTQIAREQVAILGDDVGTVLTHADYHRVVEGFGGAGLVVEDADAVPAAMQQAKIIAASGRPVLLNAILGKTDFRKGSISM